MKQLFNFIKLAKSKTPKVGRKISKIGFGIGGVGLALEFTDAQLIEYIPEEHRIYFIVMKHAMQIVGLLFVGGGVASTESNPDEIIEE
jgi:hypothetical protein